MKKINIYKFAILGLIFINHFVSAMPRTVGPMVVLPFTVDISNVWGNIEDRFTIDDRNADTILSPSNPDILDTTANFKFFIPANTPITFYLDKYDSPYQHMCGFQITYINDIPKIKYVRSLTPDSVILCGVNNNYITVNILK